MSIAVIYRSSKGWLLVLCKNAEIIKLLPELSPSIAKAYFFFNARDGQTTQQLHMNLIRSVTCDLSYECHGGISPELEKL